MKILVIGDVHGEDIIWKLFDLKLLREFPELATDFDYYIFLGDYSDSYTITAPKIMENLRGIIKLKKNYPDKVILLIGNHDLHYLHSHIAFPCSGYNYLYGDKLAAIYEENRNLFQPLFYINNLLFSHAGISNKWLVGFNKEFGILDEELHPNAISESYYQATLPDQLDIYTSIFDVGVSRGGDCRVGGIFWADFSETSSDIVPGWHQIVGHTPVKEIKRFQIDKTNIELGSITYINTIPATEEVSKIAYALEV